MIQLDHGEWSEEQKNSQANSCPRLAHGIDVIHYCLRVPLLRSHHQTGRKNALQAIFSRGILKEAGGRTQHMKHLIERVLSLESDETVSVIKPVNEDSKANDTDRALSDSLAHHEILLEFRSF